MLFGVMNTINKLDQNKGSSITKKFLFLHIQVLGPVELCFFSFEDNKQIKFEYEPDWTIARGTPYTKISLKEA